MKGYSLSSIIKAELPDLEEVEIEEEPIKKTRLKVGNFEMKFAETNERKLKAWIHLVGADCIRSMSNWQLEDILDKYKITYKKLMDLIE